MNEIMKVVEVANKELGLRVKWVSVQPCGDGWEGFSNVCCWLDKPDFHKRSEHFGGASCVLSMRVLSDRLDHLPYKGTRGYWEVL